MGGLITGLIGGVGTALLLFFIFFLFFSRITCLDTSVVIINTAGSLFIALLGGLIAGWAGWLDQSY